MNISEEIKSMLRDYRYAIEGGLIWQLNQEELMRGVMVDLESLLEDINAAS